MQLSNYLKNGILGATALIFVGARFVPGANANGPVLTAAAALVVGKDSTPEMSSTSLSAVATKTTEALRAFAAAVRPLSHPKALEVAFHSYFSYKATHPAEVKKPLLYFVDYGLPSTKPRGYIFDMNTLQVVEGPFTVAHGRGSSTSQYGVPTRFSNASGSAATSLGLYVAQNTYAFHGKTAGQPYSSIGLKLQGVSGNFNSNARARGVVAHGAPYVTPARAGRSEGCPAMEQQRAQRVLPELANGGMVFLFGLDQEWMADDPWVAAAVD
ncbi:MAG: murein L,D-transpeptidase catalytic domain-containing protein [Gemmatimonadaceae bacterium]